MGFTKEQYARDKRFDSIQLTVVLTRFLVLYALFIVLAKATKLIKTVFHGKPVCAGAFGF